MRLQLNFQLKTESEQLQQTLSGGWGDKWSEVCSGFCYMPAKKQRQKIFHDTITTSQQNYPLLVVFFHRPQCVARSVAHSFKQKIKKSHVLKKREYLAKNLPLCCSRFFIKNRQSMFSELRR